jgi:hypothetical protein
MNRKFFLRGLKSITPPVVYDTMQGIYHSLVQDKIDLSDKFPGKVFCIGLNKTGTTSVEQVLRSFGYSLGHYGIAVMLIYDWHRGDFRRLIQYCKTAQAFQDIPFSLPRTYKSLDGAFPDAKFILTIRDSEDQWFRSLTRYHTKRYSSDKSRPPNEEDLKKYSDYPYYGYVLDIMKMVFDYPTVALYDYQYYTERYRQHNQDAIQYFHDKPNKLLILNVSQPGAYQQLASFLNVKVPEGVNFPWKNKT